MRPLLLLPLAALAVAAPPAPAPAPLFAPAPAAKREAMDEAVDRGLDYLRSVQNPDGSWGNPGGNPWGGGGLVRPGNRPQGTGDIAVTSLAVMAFLSAGHVPGEGHYGAIILRGIDWVLAQQKDDGRLVPPPTQSIEMYHHGIATLMLAEAVGLTPAESADRLRTGLEKAVKVILAGQRKAGGRGWADHAGGWRYHVSPNGPYGTDADLSVSGWQLMALRAAKNVGCDVPADRIAAAVEYVKRHFDEASGGFRYQPNGPLTTPCTGVGVLCLELSGKEYHLCDQALRGGAYLLKKPLSSRDGYFFYGVYYVSQATFQLGGNYWESYRPKLHKLLLSDAAPNPNGGWFGGGGDGAGYGSAYSTSMAILALTVEYRFLPIYQRFEEPRERDGKE